MVEHGDEERGGKEVKTSMLSDACLLDRRYTYVLRRLACLLEALLHALANALLNIRRIDILTKLLTGFSPNSSSAMKPCVVARLSRNRAWNGFLLVLNMFISPFGTRMATPRLRFRVLVGTHQRPRPSFGAGAGRVALC